MKVLISPCLIHFLDTIDFLSWLLRIYTSTLTAPPSTLPTVMSQFFVKSMMFALLQLCKYLCLVNYDSVFFLKLGLITVFSFLSLIYNCYYFVQKPQ